MSCLESRIYGDCMCCDWPEPEELYECRFCDEYDLSDICRDCQHTINKLRYEPSQCVVCGDKTEGNTCTDCQPIVIRA